ncbi:hypothetical protein MYXA107069_17910 [Myxococcus xanthus]|nr:hypothetical protein MyxoNM_28590 [Myxococcus xanthus]SDX15992.1 Integrase core domain-containing protein [Myxococcus xanthus]
MWGTDATCTVTTLEGQATVFIAVDDGTAECVGIHAAKVGSRFEALEPIRRGIKARFGAYGQGVASGLAIRHDNGSQYTSDVFQNELRFLGANSSPSFIRSPEGNGCAERFIRPPRSNCSGCAPSPPWRNSGWTCWNGPTGITSTRYLSATTSFRRVRPSGS